MTLPIRTSGLVVAYIISGGLGGVVYSSALLIIASFAVHPQNIFNAILLVPFMFVLATGLAGLAAFFASISRRGEIYWVYAQALQVSLITIGTFFYPANTLPHYLPAPIPTIPAFTPSLPPA